MPIRRMTMPNRIFPLCLILCTSLYSSSDYDDYDEKTARSSKQTVVVKEKVDTKDESSEDDLIGQMEQLVLTPVTPYDQYQKVLGKFLDKKKKSKSEHRAKVNLMFQDFMTKYEAKKTITLDVSNCSSRVVISLLTKIGMHKSKVKNIQEFWRDEKPSFFVGTKEVTYDEKVDQVPTIFKIGAYEYKLELAATKSKPGGGRLYGLTADTVADSYKSVSTWLTAQKKNLPLYKECLKEGQQGKPTKLVFKAKDDKPERECVEINKFLNGLRLLLCFEVSRRFVPGDAFQSLPVLLTLPYLLEQFDNLDTVQECFTQLFAGDNREKFVLERVIPHQKTLADAKLLRDRLRMFHTDDENSEDEYDD